MHVYVLQVSAGRVLWVSGDAGSSGSSTKSANRGRRGSRDTLPLLSPRSPQPPPAPAEWDAARPPWVVQGVNHLYLYYLFVNLIYIYLFWLDVFTIEVCITVLQCLCILCWYSCYLFVTMIYLFWTHTEYIRVIVIGWYNNL